MAGWKTQADTPGNVELKVWIATTDLRRFCLIEATCIVLDVWNSAYRLHAYYETLHELADNGLVLALSTISGKAAQWTYISNWKSQNREDLNQVRRGKM